jgi:hypothetical protein
MSQLEDIELQLSKAQNWDYDFLNSQSGNTYRNASQEGQIAIRDELIKQLTTIKEDLLKQQAESKPNIPVKPTSNQSMTESKPDNTLRNILLVGGALLLLG